MKVPVAGLPLPSTEVSIQDDSGKEIPMAIPPIKGTETSWRFRSLGLSTKLTFFAIGVRKYNSNPHAAMAIK